METKAPGLSSPTALLKDSFSLYKTHFKTFLAILIIPVLLEVVVLLLELTATGEVLGVALNLVAILQTVFGIIASIVLIKIISDLHNGNTFTEIGPAYRQGLIFFLPLIWIGILSAIITWGAFTLLIIPALIVGVYISTAQFVVVEESERGMKAFVKSWNYVKGNWKQVFWRHAFLALLAIGIFAVVATPAFIIGSMNAEMFEAKIPLFAPLISVFEALVAIASLLFLQPLVTIYYYYVYRELKAMKPEPFVEEEKDKVKTWLTILTVLGVISGIVLILLILGMLFIAAALSMR